MKRTFLFRRLFVIALGGVLAIASGWHAAVLALSDIQPSLAIKLDPSSSDSIARIEAVKLARKMEEGKPTNGSARHLRQALKSDPLNTSALRLLAVTTEQASAEAPNYNILKLANRVTRRDLGVQILLVREAARRGDIAGALSAYDSALRTSARSWDLLFPNLAQAIETDGSEKYFEDVLKTDPPWLAQFLVFAIGQTEKPEVYFDLLIRSNAIAALSQKEEIAEGIINRLVSTGNLSLAKTAFRATQVGETAILNSPNLALGDRAGEGNAFTWQIINSGGVGAQLIGGRILNAFADAGRSGTVARKVLFLAGGTYRLTAEVDRESASGTLGWETICLGGINHAQTIGSLPETNEISEEGGSGSWTLNVPRNCEAILIGLQVSGGERVTGSSYLVENIHLQPIN